MSTTKGKRYERKVASKLREFGWIVDWVTGGGGFSGTGDCDLVILAPSQRMTLRSARTTLQTP